MKKAIGPGGAMRWVAALLLSLSLGLALTACGRGGSPAAPGAASASAVATASAPTEPQAAAKAGHDGFQFARVESAIEVRRDGVVLQRLEIPESAEAPDIEVIDMNFDGAPDLRVIDVQPAGPNVSYVNWLFDPATQRFARSTALDELVAPKFDAARHEVTSSWRDGPARYVQETLAWTEGELVPLRREVETHASPDHATRTREHWREGRWTTE